MEEIGSDELPIVEREVTEEIESVSQDREDYNEGVPGQDTVDGRDLPEIRVYKRRWYILFVFCLLACHQCIVWNTFGPIETAVQYAYGWTNFEAPMMANWGCIMFLVAVVPLTKLAEQNMRLTVLVVSGCVALGTVLRCCHYFASSYIFLISCHICAILNGIAGVTIMAAPPLISSHWFPPDQRTTATSINQAANMLGNGLSMLMGPGLVTVPSNCSTDINRMSTSCPDKVKVMNEIDNYMVLHAGIAVAIFMLFCLYFPSKPPHPPAPTSAIQRTEFWEGTKAIFKNKNALLLCFSYSMGGVLGSWLSVMVNNFRPFSISDQEIGFIGLLAVIGQCIMTTSVGVLMDRLKHKMKISLIVLISLATAGFVWLMLICIHQIEFSKAQVYVSVILSASISFSCYPIFFEMTVEVTYPVHESIVGGFLTAFYNLVGIMFLLIFFIPNIGFEWINYVLVASTVVALPAIILTRESYNRSSVDEAVSNNNY